MAYKNINKLRLILKIQNLFNEHKTEGVTTAYVYRKHIFPVYRISYATFYNYLATPAQKLIREHEQMEQAAQAKTTKGSGHRCDA